MVWQRRRGRGEWFYSHSPSWKKNGFEREEEDWEDGFIPIHSVANNGKKKKVWKRRKGEEEEMGLGNDVMGLPMCVRVFM